MSEQGIPHITCEHLQSLKDGDMEHVVVDLRDFNEYESGHIRGAKSCPRRELADNIETVVPDRKHKVVVIIGPVHEPEIESIHRELREMGYENIEFLAGGFDRWCEIAPMEIEPELLEMTPEEEGFVGDELTDVDPEKSNDEPMY
ncbi:hypothetical protein JW899_01865 [Candidatus Uhrbacteria bacterium]|nr:hypothetical protein [Candidatus Uhrbacteria bacterium]